MEEHMHHHGHEAWLLLIFGVLLILNAIFNVVSWVIFAGIIAIIAAIFFFAKGCCKEKKR